MENNLTNGTEGVMTASEGKNVERQVYLAEDIARILGIGRSKSYEFLEEVFSLQGKKDAPFKVIRVGKLIRVVKSSFDSWLQGAQ